MSFEKTLITIITEAVLETNITKKIEALGAHGYTVLDVRGKGQRGSRSGEWQVSSNIQIEVICTDNVAQTIVQHLQDEYFSDYGMIVYQSQVNVLRSEKF
jgi:nitrogen regulatory protein PII